MNASEMKSGFPQLVEAARKLVANPQRTTEQRLAADEVRQEMARQGLAAWLVTAVGYVRSGSL